MFRPPLDANELTLIGRGELSDETNSARAFSFFPVCLNIGVLIASTLGGSFGNINRFPRLRDSIPLFKTFPYLLANLLTAIITLIPALIALIWLRETLPPKPVIKQGSGEANAEPTTAASTEPAEGNANDQAESGPVESTLDVSYKSLFSRHITALMFSFGILSLLGGVQGTLIPLFCFTPIHNGGLGFTSTEIGNTLSLRAIATLSIQLFVFPPLQRRIGTVRLYQWLMCLWIPSFLGYPVLNGLARNDHPTLVWIGLAFVLILSSIANMAFGKSQFPLVFLNLLANRIAATVCNLIMTNAAAPSRRLLGAINGYSQFIQAIVRIIGPGGASILFAVSIDKQILGGSLVWIVLGLVGVIGVFSGLLI